MSQVKDSQSDQIETYGREEVFNHRECGLFYTDETVALQRNIAKKIGECELNVLSIQL